jgi:hypothetical protein
MWYAVFVPKPRPGFDPEVELQLYKYLQIQGTKNTL